MEDRRRIPIVDKRVSSRGDSPRPPADDASATEAAAEEAPADARPGDAAPVPDLAIENENEAVAEGAVQEVAEGHEIAEEEERKDFLDDLRRLQADFDNYRKRMMREQATTTLRAKTRFMEQLLPVLDAFEQALTHDEGNGGTELIYKQLRSVLETEGLEEIPAEGVPFDPHVHEAVESREDPDVDDVVARSVYRRGYKVGDQVLRAAMVVVARPPEDEAPEAMEG